MAGAIPTPQQWIGAVPQSGLQTDAAPAMPAPDSDYPYMPVSTYTPIQGTGGYPSPGAGLISGLEAGMNVTSAFQANRRRAQSYNLDQLANTSKMIDTLNIARQKQGLAPLANIGDPGFNSNELTPYLSQSVTPNPLMSGIKAAGSSISNGAQKLASALGFQRGGPVPVNRPSPLPFLAPEEPNGVGVSHQAEPGISGYAAGGPVGPPAMSATPAGAAMPDATGVGPVVPSAIPPQVAAAPGGTAAQPAPSLADLTNAYAIALHHSALNDDGVPNHIAASSQPGIPSGAGGSAGAQYPAPGQAHSLTTDFWDATDHDAMMASAFAARAGQDPNQMYHALTAMRNSFYQGQVLKQLSAAQLALQNGDQQSVTKALQGLYYYMPDGRDMTLRRNAQGQIEYQDPIQPYLDKDGKPTTGLPGSNQGVKENFVPVTAQHLQLLGQAALDPMAVSGMQLRMRMIPFEMKQAELQTQAKVLTGQGTFLRGQGISAEGAANAQKAQAEAARVASENYLDLSLADRARAQAVSQRLVGSMLSGARLNPQLQANVASTLKLLDGALTGTPQATDPNNLAGGKVVPNANTVPPGLRNISRTDRAQLQATASSLAATGMAPAQAMNIALQSYLLRNQTHPAQFDKSEYARRNKGGPIPNVIPDASTGKLHIWDSSVHAWRDYAMLPQGASMLAGGSGSMQKLLLQALIAGQQASGSVPLQGAAGGAPSALSADMSPYGEQ